MSPRGLSRRGVGHVTKGVVTKGGGACHQGGCKRVCHEGGWGHQRGLGRKEECRTVVVGVEKNEPEQTNETANENACEAQIVR